MEEYPVFKGSSLFLWEPKIFPEKIISCSLIIIFDWGIFWGVFYVILCLLLSGNNWRYGKWKHFHSFRYAKMEADVNRKKTVVCLSTKQNYLLPCSLCISRIKISYSTAHGISPSFCTTTMNAGHIFAEQVSYSESRIYPFRSNFNKTGVFFFFFF